MTRFYAMALTGFLTLVCTCLLAQQPFLVTDIYPGDVSQQNYSRPRNLVPYGDQLLFTADAPSVDIELYITDGTAAGTRQLTNINRTNSFQNIDHIKPLGIIDSLFYHSAREPQFGWELYVTDPRTGESRRLSDIAPGGEDATPRGGTVLNGELLFTAESSGIGREWYKYSPQLDTVIFLGDVNPGSGSSAPFFGGAFVFGDRAYYVGTDAVNGREIFATDGTPDGTGVFVNGRPGSESPFRLSPEFAVFQEALYLPYSTVRQGIELGRTVDGSADGLQIMAATNGGPGSGIPADLAVAGDALFFTALGTQTSGRRALYYTRGDSADFQMVDIFPTDTEIDWYGVIESPSGDPARLMAAGGTLYGVWVNEGAFTIFTIPGTNGGNPENVVTVGTTAYFTMERDNGRELYRYRRGEGDAVQVTNFTPDRFQDEVKFVTRAGNFIYFEANAADVGEELFALRIDNPDFGIFATRLGGDTLTVMDEITFNEVRSRTDSTRVVTLRNDGTAGLRYTATLNDAELFSLPADTIRGTLAAGATTGLPITFSPLTEGMASGELFLEYILNGTQGEITSLTYSLTGNAIVNSITNQGLRALSVFPNPVGDQLTVQLAEAPTAAARYTLVSMSGQRLSAGQWPAGQAREQFAVGDLLAGVYLLTIVDANKRTVIRLLKQ